MNAGLPHAVQAFWALDDGLARQDAMGIDVVRAHRDFLSLYGLDEEHVPLLRLDPNNWDQPFSSLQHNDG